MKDFPKWMLVLAGINLLLSVKFSILKDIRWMN